MFQGATRAGPRRVHVLPDGGRRAAEHHPEPGQLVDEREDVGRAVPTLRARELQGNLVSTGATRAGNVLNSAVKTATCVSALLCFGLLVLFRWLPLVACWHHKIALRADFLRTVFDLSLLFQ